MKEVKAIQRTVGFTLIEIMVTVMIISILIAVAVPNFVRSRNETQKESCLKNLQEIDSAKERFAMETNTASGTVVDPSSLVPDYLKTALPVCQGGGTYDFGDIGTDPSCSVHGTVDSNLVP
jgi:prepilin-type N-terminal cleavage/methylation domain-containing protein